MSSDMESDLIRALTETYEPIPNDAHAYRHYIARAVDDLDEKVAVLLGKKRELLDHLAEMAEEREVKP